MRTLATAALILVLLHYAGTRFIGYRRTREIVKPEACDTGLAVSLVVSSVPTDEGHTRLLEIHWENAPLGGGDFLAVFDKDPAAGNQTFPDPLFSVRPAVKNGHSKTNIFSEIPVDLGFVERCLGHWVAYVRPSIDSGPPEILASSCIKTRPTWMYDLRSEIGQKKFRELYIPGTHDSGSFSEGPGDRITKYTYTQEEDILNQLIFGNRYLDIRVGYYPPSTIERLPNGTWVNTIPRSTPDEEVFWLNHGLIKIRKLKEVIDQVKEFLSSTNEIVIFDVQEFPVGFGGQDGLSVHVRLMTFLEREFRDHAANVSMGGLWWDTPVNTFWEANKRLIIGYDNSAAREEAANIAEAAGKGRGGSVIWKAVSQQWGNVRNAADLRNYFTSVLSHPPADVWSAMAELTPNTWDVIGDGPGGLRKMADAVNRNVTEWFGGTWGLYANVVATDYFRANDIVEAAIKWNHWRAVWSTNCRKL